MASEKSRETRKIRPNPLRQLILVGLAVVGLALGYGLGFVFKAAPPEPAAKSAHPAPVAEKPQPTVPTPAHPQLPPPNVVLPEDVDAGNTGPVRAYEEALPKEIVVTVERIGPSPPSAPTRTEAPSPPTTQTEAPPSKKATVPVLAETASLPNPPMPAPSDTQPPVWQHHAVKVKRDGRPMIAIVFDDLGIDKSRTARAIALPGPLSMSFLTYATRLDMQTAAARGAGHEIWMHVPMEPGSATIDPGPHVLLTGLSRNELLSNLRWSLDQFDGYVGINNHMGSRFTADASGMDVVMKELKARGLAFLDSVTSGASKGRRAALAAGVDFASRNIFIDHEDDIGTIEKQLAKIESLARKQGHAVAIGHPREKTLRAITPWLKNLSQRGFQLVPVSVLLQQPG